tara:strand:- start:47 stop:241 length:195 start_codon:yes stop_codon:yes gene_type:complete
MTKAKALQQLKQTRTLSTDMLSALDVTFEQFLRLGQMADGLVQKAYDALIKREEGKLRATLSTT